MNITDIIQQNGIIYDRYLGSTLSLPYSSFDAIKIQPNETVTNFNLNSIINKLYDNYLYLYKSAYIASNIIPIGVVAMAGVSGTFGIPSSFNKLTWYQNLIPDNFGHFSAVSAIDIVHSNVFKVKYNKALGKYIIFTSPGSSLTIFNSLTSDQLTIDNGAVENNFTLPSSFTLALSTNTVFNGSNTSWSRIQDIAFGDNNQMYVLDLSANSVIQYDASGILSDNNVLKDKLVYLNGIGGLGSFDDNTLFRYPNSIMYYNSELYVLDAGNYCIKKYDANLNYKTTYRLFKDFLSAGPIQITHDSFGSIYILNSNWTAYKYNNNFTIKQITDFTELSGDGNTRHGTIAPEKIKQIIFSKTDSNIFYLVTTEEIYKKFVNKPQDSVGRYLEEQTNFSSSEIVLFDTLPVTVDGVDYDYNFVIENHYFGETITLLKDNINVASILINDVFDVYPLSAITINSEEYLQNWVINKSVSKLIINHMRLRDNIASKFLYQKSDLSDDILLAGERYLLPAELTKIDFEQDVSNYIGANEIFQNNIVNRPFKAIFDTQTNLLSALAADVQNYYTTPQIVYLT